VTTRKVSSGFTLIELMIVVAIIGILASIAIPAYNQFLLKGRRAEAQSMLLGAQLAQEKNRLRTGSYYVDMATLKADCGAACTAEEFYTFGCSGTCDANTYTLSASAKGKQLSDTGCTTFTIAANGTTTGCWSN
jgi:type IV pilus assembly protein PilE